MYYFLAYTPMHKSSFYSIILVLPAAFLWFLSPAWAATDPETSKTDAAESSNSPYVQDNVVSEGNMPPEPTAKPPTTSLNDYTRGKLNLSKTLAIAGTVTWAAGVGLEIASLIAIFSSIASGDDLGQLFTTIGVAQYFAIAGLSLELLSPIFSVVGEKMAKNAVGQYDWRALGNSSKMSSGFFYILSSGLAGIGILFIALQHEVLSGIGGLFTGTSHVLGGIAAIAPLVRISRYNRQHGVNLSFSPNFSPNGAMGLAVDVRF